MRRQKQQPMEESVHAWAATLQQQQQQQQQQQHAGAAGGGRRSASSGGGGASGRAPPAAALAGGAGAAAAAAAAQGPRVKTFSVAAPPALPRPKMHVDSSQVGALLNPVRGIRDAQRRAGLTPTDHGRHNRLAVLERSRLNALHKAAAADAAAAEAAHAFKPRLVARRSSSSGGGGGALSSSSSSGGDVGAGGTPRPWSASSSQQQQRMLAAAAGPPRDFVAENKAAAAAAARPVNARDAAALASARGERASSAAPSAAGRLRRDQCQGSGSGSGSGGGSSSGGGNRRHSEFGAVPAYLLARKLQLAGEAEAREAARVAAAVPPGLRRLPEEERRAALATLEANRAGVEAQLAALPIVVETRGQVRHKEALEQRLREIDDATRVFSRPHVLVRDTTATSA